MFIGDASGHGPSAAVVAAMVQATLHATAPGSAGPADLFRTLNRRLCHKRIEGSFLTAFMGFYEPATRRLRYASAGHPAPPLLPCLAGRPARILNTAGGPPLGIDDGVTFDEATIDLPPGHTLLLYTDGISKAPPDGAMFGPEGIERSLQNCGDDAQGVINRLRQSLITHQRGRRPDDDQTAVAIQSRGVLE